MRPKERSIVFIVSALEVLRSKMQRVPLWVAASRKQGPKKAFVHWIVFYRVYCIRYIHILKYSTCTNCWLSLRGGGEKASRKWSHKDASVRRGRGEGEIEKICPLACLPGQCEREKTFHPLFICYFLSSPSYETRGCREPPPLPLTDAERQLGEGWTSWAKRLVRDDTRATAPHLVTSYLWWPHCCHLLPFPSVAV